MLQNHMLRSSSKFTSADFYAEVLLPRDVVGIHLIVAQNLPVMRPRSVNSERTINVIWSSLIPAC